MNVHKSVNIVAVAAGLILGLLIPPSEVTQPPLQWDHMPFLFFGSIFVMLFTAGIQLMRKNPKYSKTMLIIFIPLSILVFSMGVGIFVSAIYFNELNPYKILYLAIGAGLLIGVGISTMIFKAKFQNAL